MQLMPSGLSLREELPPWQRDRQALAPGRSEPYQRRHPVLPTAGVGAIDRSTGQVTRQPTVRRFGDPGTGVEAGPCVTGGAIAGQGDDLIGGHNEDGELAAFMPNRGASPS
jgi:hypothetical protein